MCECVGGAARQISVYVLREGTVRDVRHRWRCCHAGYAIDRRCMEN
jgi:hypothetical protein